MLWDWEECDPRPMQRQRQEPRIASQSFEDSPSQVAVVNSSPDYGLDNRSENQCRQSRTAAAASAAAPEIDAAACAHGSVIAVGNHIDDRAAGSIDDRNRSHVGNRHAADSSRSATPCAGVSFCAMCGRCCACRPVQPPASYPPLTTWVTSCIHAWLPSSEVGAATALKLCIACIDKIILANPTRYKIGMTGDVKARWDNAYNGIYGAMHVLHATRSKDCSFMLEASLIELYSHFDRRATKLVNLENRDGGGTGRPRDDVPWYYVYIVSFNAAERLHPLFARRRH